MIFNKYHPGDHFVRCDRSGFKILASESKKEWNGLRVWKRVWEARQPQDFVRGRRDDQTVPDPRPDIAENFLTTNEVSTDDL